MSNFFFETYKKHFLLAELLISILIILLIAFIIQNIWDIENIESWITTNCKSFYPLVATISGTLFGFVITSVSILFVFPDTPSLKRLKQSKSYKDVFIVYLSTIKYLGITLIISVIGLLCTEYILILFYLLLWSIIISTLRIWRCLWILKNLIDIMIMDKKSNKS